MAEAVEYFSKLKMTEFQQEIAERIANMLNMYLSTDLDALKYYMYKVLYHWQESTGTPIEYFDTAPPEERLKMVRFWLDEVKTKHLSKILSEEVNPDSLENAVEFAFIFYQEKYAFR